MNQQPNQGLSFGNMQQQQMLLPKKKNQKSNSNRNYLLITLHIISVCMLGFIIYLMYFPPFINIDTTNQEVLEAVSELTEINIEDPNIFIAQINDIEELRNQNEIQTEVYKDARNGDYAVAYEDKVIVYRKEDNQIIYNDLSPAAILQNQNQQLLDNINQAARTIGIPIQESETPQLLVVEDAEVQKQADPEFYANILQGDIIAIYSVSGSIMIYRPDTQSVINDGNVRTIIEED